MRKRALVLLTNGAEEMETVIPVDVLRRAEIDVTVANVKGSGNVKCSRNVVIVPDCDLETAMNNSYDAILMPGGGEGAKTLSTAETVQTLIKDHYNSGKLLCAICAAPIALKAAGIGLNKTRKTKLTSHPGVKDQVSEMYDYQESRVVKDGNLITSRGPGTAFDFALAIVEELMGKEIREKIVPPMML